MQIAKRKENYKNPVKTSKRNFFAIGLIYVILSVLFYSTKPEVSIGVLVSGILALMAGYFLSKQKMAGVYLGWLFVLVGILSVLVTSAYISLVVVAYIGYWNYKASVVMKSKSM